MQEEQRMDDDLKVHELILKHADGTLNEEERLQLEQWLGQSAARQELLRKATDKQFVDEAIRAIYAIDKPGGWDKLSARMPGTSAVLPFYRRRKKYLIAASVAALVLAGSYVFYASRSSQQSTGIARAVNLPENYKNDVLPGGNKAMLTLADGSQVSLDDAANGMLAEQGNSKVVKTSDGRLAYDAGKGSRANNTGSLAYNTVSTPRGGQYEVVLPDGTHAWLNAASRLRFPASFAAAERTVDVSGEAYFEVAHRTDEKGHRVPFKVNIISASGTAQVEVLGTHFNVMAYDDEGSVNTTLLEGSVKITKGAASQVIVPGQQAQVSLNGGISVKPDANLETTMAWKNGLFDFEYDDISTIMRQMARWYSIEVVFEGKVPGQHFRATISRNMPASKLLQVLELTGNVHFRVDGKKVTVTQ